jgi:Uma2 family endonuclease
MSTLTAEPPALTVADLAERFGPMPLHRIRFFPFPGTATEQDVLAIHAREKRLCELIDGILVEKVMGYRESVLALFIARVLGNWVAPRRLGVLAGEAGMMRLARGLVRIPDVSFVSWKRLPGGHVPEEPIPDLTPDLAVEVLSPSNTDAEMATKLHNYFAAGVRLVWYVDPRTRTVDIYTALDRSTRLTEDRTLDGGDVLPGFALSLRELFAELDKASPAGGEGPSSV